MARYRIENKAITRYTPRGTPYTKWLDDGQRKRDGLLARDIAYPAYRPAHRGRGAIVLWAILAGFVVFVACPFASASKAISQADGINAMAQALPLIVFFAMFVAVLWLVRKLFGEED